MSSPASFDWVAGVDVAKDWHEVRLLDTRTDEYRRYRCPNSGRGYRAFADWLVETTGAQPAEIAIALELPDGPLVETMLALGFRVLSINPKQADCFRGRLSLSGAKDDPRDARVLASAASTDRAAFREVRERPPALVALRRVTRERGDVVAQITKLGQQIREQLAAYWPEMESILGPGEATAEWFMALWSRIPTPERARRMRVSTLAAQLARSRMRRFEAAKLKEMLTTKPALVSAAGVASRVDTIRRLLRRVRLLKGDLRDLDASLRRLLEEARSVPATAAGRPGDAAPVVDQAGSLSGIGPVVTATLLAEVPELLVDGNYRGLRAVAGTAPVTVRSGKSWQRVRMRRAVNQRVRHAIACAMRVAVCRDPACRAACERYRARGDSWNTALRKVGDRQLRILSGMIHNGTLYDPQRALAASRAA